MKLAMLIPALGWSLLYFVWQGLAVGALAALGLWLLRGADARARYAVCALALLACVGIPLAHLLFLLGAVALPSSGLSVAALNAWMPALVLAWSAGVALMSLRLLLGLAWVARLRRQAVAAPAVWQQRLDTLALRMGLRYPVPLRLHGALAGPVTVGFFRPLVLLPASLLSGMPVPLLEALLAHELAHVRRWDYLLNLLQSVAEALLFFHPVVWWLSATCASNANWWPTRWPRNPCRTRPSWPAPCISCHCKRAPASMAACCCRRAAAPCSRAYSA